MSETRKTYLVYSFMIFSVSFKKKTLILLSQQWFFKMLIHLNNYVKILDSILHVFTIVYFISVFCYFHFLKFWVLSQFKYTFKYFLKKKSYGLYILWALMYLRTPFWWLWECSTIACTENAWVTIFPPQNCVDIVLLSPTI